MCVDFQSATINSREFQLWQKLAFRVGGVQHATRSGDQSSNQTGQVKMLHYPMEEPGEGQPARFGLGDRAICNHNRIKHQRTQPLIDSGGQKSGNGHPLFPESKDPAAVNILPGLQIVKAAQPIPTAMIEDRLAKCTTHQCLPPPRARPAPACRIG
jgi:hypothetical protein